MSHVNLTNLTFLVADANSFYREIMRRALRSFGAAEVLEAADSARARTFLHTKQVDAFICDAELEDANGFDLIHSIRMDDMHPLRSIPMLISTGTTRRTDVNLARNAGANMVIKKPMAPMTVYDRLAWISGNPRAFWESDSYYGPDRRVGRSNTFDGEDRRMPTSDEEAIDQAFEVNQDDAA